MPSSELKQRTSTLRTAASDVSAGSTSRSVSPTLEEVATVPKAAHSKGKSLADRKKIPSSFIMTFGTVLGLEFFGGLWQRATLESWYASLKEATLESGRLMGYTKDVLSLSSLHNWTECVRTGALVVALAALFYVFFVAPAMAGLWTGRKAKRHKFHRYMGLSYLIHYVLAWVEFLTNEESGKTSYLCHVIAVHGILQGSSAYFSFKVLPELTDPGYYSDKAVLSRTFVHENIYFTVLAVFGSIYYHEEARTTMRTTLGGRLIEFLYVFWPFVLVRTWYPLTQFSNAGQTYKGRTVKNQKFYEIATLMVKFFYLWAKYFLGFFVNFMVFLDLVKDEHWRLINGMLLLNAGTVSLSIFLHTLRFKKVLPAKLTMSIYLGQIYLTFLAVPIAVEMFMEHPKLCGLCFGGLMANATRNRKLHAVWCGLSMLLLTQTEIQW